MRVNWSVAITGHGPTHHNLFTGASTKRNLKASEQAASSQPEKETRVKKSHETITPWAGGRKKRTGEAETEIALAERVQ